MLSLSVCLASSSCVSWAGQIYVFHISLSLLAESAQRVLRALLVTKASQVSESSSQTMTLLLLPKVKVKVDEWLAGMSASLSWLAEFAFPTLLRDECRRVLVVQLSSQQQQMDVSRASVEQQHKVCFARVAFQLADFATTIRAAALSIDDARQADR